MLKVGTLSMYLFVVWVCSCMCVYTCGYIYMCVCEYVNLNGDCYGMVKTMVDVVK